MSFEALPRCSTACKHNSSTSAYYMENLAKSVAQVTAQFADIPDTVYNSELGLPRAYRPLPHLRAVSALFAKDRQTLNILVAAQISQTPDCSGPIRLT
jgi:hypothetical protein